VLRHDVDLPDEEQVRELREEKFSVTEVGLVAVALVTSGALAV
jgi:hypothetical protein